ncbi:methyltransferase domain-containing protein [Verminephrobacter aporrectodeae subsp. tuberculatae]|uniref:Methyltransferase domain-containing protein n=1 Tax=Verminephrobacter aporrectodeae subsp. tuberculatae TaxID=1110392 RepID=A0ABT3KN44_9BURK|nr:methyltransferase domain-containing protein [Verminephrobacter aporrectodeae subsp. tuberculatae]MCW5254906.1 methyltransferase domain-containing protein [Verminephrobacter aporrectodeae subsp. tuberculatae]MCW5290443.1 methyltransferase domain-containing protein [Verminephrobacter aporrectodeae subsp. tuberculatae]MCW5319746.1 methyltransferase domain-containing protein [Verminephrobacter aporrectodeae subsp. tuberculatae]MCW8166317.1 methyltransferase domain-containing protein [Verminephro
MWHQLTGLHNWFDSPPGRYLLAWEQARFDEAVADVFGYHSLQLGMPLLDGLRANRMPHRWLALGQDALADDSGLVQTGAPGSRTLALLAEPVALPFAKASLDLIVLPHTLELSIDPHAALREVERVLVPEGRVVISGLNPASLWGLRQRRAHLYQRLGKGTQYLPGVDEFIAYRRLRDWLRLLSFEVESTRFGCYRPAVRSAQWLERFGWMDRLGEKWWPILGAAYFLVAVKRVYGMRLLESAWRSKRQRSAATVPIAHRTANTPAVKRRHEAAAKPPSPRA